MRHVYSSSCRFPFSTSPASTPWPATTRRLIKVDDKVCVVPGEISTLLDIEAHAYVCSLCADTDTDSVTHTYVYVRLTYTYLSPLPLALPPFLAL